MDWSNPFIANYVQLQKGVTPKQLEQPIAYLLKQNADALLVADLKPYLVPLHNYYLDANNGVVRKMIYALSAIALFILIMAIINFINMFVSRSAARMREIWIRKVLVGLKKQLVIQFLIESIIITFFATVFAFVIYAVTKNLFSNMLGSDIPSLTQFFLYFIVIPFLLVLFIGFIAGIYPAFVLSSLKSVESLKEKLTSVKDNVLLRKSLIAFQFATATIACVGVIIIAQQINLFLSKDLGYNKDYIISAQLPRDWTPAGVKRMMIIRDKLASTPGVQSAAISYEVPDGNNIGQSYIYKQGGDSAAAIPMQLLINDENYLNLYKIPLLAGNVFNGRTLDSGKLILIKRLFIRSASRMQKMQLANSFAWLATQ